MSFLYKSLIILPDQPTFVPLICTILRENTELRFFSTSSFPRLRASVDTYSLRMIDG